MQIIFKLNIFSEKIQIGIPFNQVCLTCKICIDSILLSYINIKMVLNVKKKINKLKKS